MTKVVVEQVLHYEYTAVEAGLHKALDLLGGLTQFINQGDRVLIKPNMLEAVGQELAVTTHPEVLRSVIRAVRQAGAVPLVGDSPGIGSCVRAAEKCGILAVCKQENAELLLFDQSVEVAMPAGTILKKISLAREFTQVDKIISLAKMKTHTFMGVTGAVKNLFGFIVGPQKAQFHLRMRENTNFAAMLVDLNEAIKPTLYIVDGIVGMEGNGPRNGTPKATGILLAGCNGFAVDLVMADKMGFKAEKMPVAARALKLGISPRLTDITVVGSGKAVRAAYQEPRTLESLDGRLPAWIVRFFRSQLTNRVAIDEHCTACGRCVSHCPPQAMRIVNNRTLVDQDKCIRCYCCQELCPHDAVILDAGLLLKMVRRIW